MCKAWRASTSFSLDCPFRFSRPSTPERVRQRAHSCHQRYRRQQIHAARQVNPTVSKPPGCAVFRSDHRPSTTLRVRPSGSCPSTSFRVRVAETRSGGAQGTVRTPDRDLEIFLAALLDQCFHEREPAKVQAYKVKSEGCGAHVAHELSHIDEQ